jgi:hypothetical protein
MFLLLRRSSRRWYSSSISGSILSGSTAAKGAIHDTANSNETVRTTGVESRYCISPRGDQGGGTDCPGYRTSSAEVLASRRVRRLATPARISADCIASNGATRSTRRNRSRSGRSAGQSSRTRGTLVMEPSREPADCGVHRLPITDNAPGSPQMVSLSGMGTTTTASNGFCVVSPQGSVLTGRCLVPNFGLPIGRCSSFPDAARCPRGARAARPGTHSCTNRGRVRVDFSRPCP